ncbi:MAG: helix-turn-helix domain-containing protein [Candidatus Porifericomitaceae bacterium WSBS_2022_MAG_OTU9]
MSKRIAIYNHTIKGTITVLTDLATHETSSNVAMAVQPEGRKCLRDHVRGCVQTYIEHLDGHVTGNLYDTVMAECELPLIQVALNHSKGNVSHAARMLGINRNTLKRKLQHYGLS